MGGIFSSKPDYTKQPVVAVVGFGYGGVAVSQNLEKNGLNVVAIDQKHNFQWHAIGGLRAMVDPEFENKVLIPTSNALTNGVVVHAHVSQIVRDSSSVSGVAIHFSEGQPMLKPDYVVICSGSSYRFPAKTSGTTAEEVVATMRRARENLKTANKILVIGGGPVGIELIGEIRHKFPQKTITLVHSGPRLINLPGFKPAFFDNLLATLKSLNVEVILDDKVDVEMPAGEDVLVGPRTFTTQKQGKTIEADLTFFCAGVSINNEAFIETLRDCVESNGKLAVNEYLQVRGFERVFALGDCANIEGAMAYYAGVQAGTVALNIKKHKDQQALTVYQKQPVMMLVPFGPNRGVGQIPLFGGYVVGDWVAGLKSKDLFAQKTWGSLNAPFPKDATTTLTTPVPSEESTKQRQEKLKNTMNLDDATSTYLASRY